MMRISRKWRVARGSVQLGLAATVLMAACTPLGDTTDAPVVAAASASAVSHVDSIFPIEEEVRRFRAALPDSATTLTGAATSLDELVARFIATLETRDTASLRRMALTAAEFAYLYYPHTQFTAHPYEMSPQLVWFQLENYGSKGLNRALDRFGGRSLAVSGYDCESAVMQGPNRLSGGCVLHVMEESGSARSVSLFGIILERDGLFKFISYGNSL
jgi:hypothetical protein